MKAIKSLAIGLMLLGVAYLIASLTNSLFYVSIVYICVGLFGYYLRYRDSKLDSQR